VEIPFWANLDIVVKLQELLDKLPLLYPHPMSIGISLAIQKTGVSARMDTNLRGIDFSKTLIQPSRCRIPCGHREARPNQKRNVFHFW
jgi:hypothetical protein